MIERPGNSITVKLILCTRCYLLTPIICSIYYRECIVIVKNFMLSFQRKYSFKNPWSQQNCLLKSPNVWTIWLSLCGPKSLAQTISFKRLQNLYSTLGQGRCTKRGFEHFFNRTPTRPKIPTYSWGFEVGCVRAI